MQTQKFNIYRINEVIIQTFLHEWSNKLFSEENKMPKNTVWGKKGGGVRHM